MWNTAKSVVVTQYLFERIHWECFLSCYVWISWQTAERLHVPTDSWTKTWSTNHMANITLLNIENFSAWDVHSNFSIHQQVSWFRELKWWCHIWRLGCEAIDSILLFCKLCVMMCWLSHVTPVRRSAFISSSLTHPVMQIWFASRLLWNCRNAKMFFNG